MVSLAVSGSSIAAILARGRALATRLAAEARSVFSHQSIFPASHTWFDTHPVELGCQEAGEVYLAGGVDPVRR